MFSNCLYFAEATHPEIKVCCLHTSSVVCPNLVQISVIQCSTQQHAFPLIKLIYYLSLGMQSVSMLCNILPFYKGYDSTVVWL